MDENTNIARNSILVTLNFNPTVSTDEKVESVLKCIFCEHAAIKSKIESENKPILQHLFTEHRLVIADVHEVLDLGEYFSFWKKEFQGMFAISLKFSNM